MRINLEQKREIGAMASNKIRVVVKTPDNVHRPILWFKANNKDEFFWGVYGRQNGGAVLRGEWNNRHTVADSARNQRYRLKSCRGKSISFDHFSSHVDGTFHLKCKGESGTLYSHKTQKVTGIGNDAPIFVEATLLTDEVNSYSPSEPRASDHAIGAPPGNFLKIFFAIAGRNHPYSDLLVEYRKADQDVGPNFEFGSFQFQSIISHQEISDRPDGSAGTVVSLRFETTSRLWLLKAFLFM
ncbi:hypothetical protein [Rhodanobacter terrae]|uniref:Uncharacterized protein n=1 Tax=Rhodanobacter terrae TaxID=418647 RepID=A0ABW0SWE5_9GAMM